MTSDPKRHNPEIRPEKRRLIGLAQGCARCDAATSGRDEDLDVGYHGGDMRLMARRSSIYIGYTTDFPQPEKKYAGSR